MEKVNRRSFVKKSSLMTAAAVTAPLILSDRAKGANERVQIGAIGVGGKGRHGMGIFQQVGGCEFAAVCDVYEPALAAAVDMTGGKAEPYKDFRKILERSDIDAVLISTPDHWHALPTVLACQAGKDVYVEKPLSLTIREGEWMVNTARHYNRVVQAGTQQRSGTHFQEAAKLVANGTIGKVTFVETWKHENEVPWGIGNPDDCDPPADLDWDLWQGPAPEHQFNPNRAFNFRWFWDYSGGKVTDWGCHLMDIVQWAMGVDSPISVSAQGGKFCLDDNRETPDTVHLSWEYPGFVATFTNRVCNSYSFTESSNGIMFYGTLGSLFVNRAGWRIYPETRGGRDLTPALSSGSSIQEENHALDFLECLRTRNKPICDVEVCHRSTSACLMGNIALRTGRKLHWDAEAQKFINDDEANGMLDYGYRGIWKQHQGKV